MKRYQAVWSAMFLAVCSVMIGSRAKPAVAELLVYEPFAYPEGNLNGQGGALGTVGSWTSFDYLQDSWPIPQDGWRVHKEGEISGVGLSGQNPANDPFGFSSFDGTVANLATSGGYVGLPGPDDVGDDDPHSGEPGRWMDASVALDPSVTATFQPGTTTWFSFVSARGWDRNEEGPQFMISTDPSPDSARGLSLLNSGDGIGGGGGPTRANFHDVFPAYFLDGINHHTPGGYQDGVLGEHDGVQDEIAPNADSNGALEDGVQTMIWEELDPDGEFGPPNIVVGKIQWDADAAGEDIISVVRFLEEDTLSEAAFDALIDDQPALSSATWESNKPDLDQSRFDTLNFSGTKYFLDEIRIGTTFADVAPSLGPGLPGDYNGNGELDAGDLDLQALAIRDGGGPEFDLNNDGQIDFNDRLVWVNDLKDSWIGDANLDLEFNSTDLVIVFQIGKYETAQPAVWAEGDWTGDGAFTSSDFVAAFQNGGYDFGVRPSVVVVPEPSTGAVFLLAGLTVLVIRKNCEFPGRSEIT